MALKKGKVVSSLRKRFLNEELEKDELEVKEEDEMELDAELKKLEAKEADEDEEVVEASDEEEAAGEDELEVEEKDEEVEDEELPLEAAKDEEEVEVAPEEGEAAEDDIEKEFDLNDETDVFIDDEDEKEAKMEAEAAACKVEEKDEEVEDEEKKDDEEVKEEDEKEEEEKKPSMDVEEHVTALFNGENLSEEFQKKARTIFESAVKEKVLEFARNLKSRYNKKLRAAKKSIQESVVNKVDGYMDYVVEEWMKENKLAVEHGLRTELTEEFITDLRSLFEAHNIMIPKGKENLVEALASKVEKLEKDVDSGIKRELSLKKKLNEQTKNEVLRSICEGLADTEIEKLKSLTSKIPYDESYREKILVIKENYFPKKTKEAAPVESISNENKNENDAPVEVSSSMAQYMGIASKMRI